AGEGKARRGGERMGPYTGSARHRTRRGEQGPEVESAGAGAGQTAGSGAQRQEGMNGPGKPGTAPREGQSPGGQTLDVAAGRNKPARQVAEQTVEGVRNAEGGT